MSKIFPSKLRKGDKLRIISPARGLSLISQEVREVADEHLHNLKFEISFSKNVSCEDESGSSSIEKRIEDIHDAFVDSSVRIILTTIGGFNSNQLLPFLDYNLIKENPKILCGYSDITALLNAIYSKTGLITYYGPHYSSFGEKRYFDYTKDYFEKCLFFKEPFGILPSKKWSNDKWYRNQEDRKLFDNEGYWIINEGKCRGTILGGNLCTFNLLQGTEYFPDLEDSILFIEDDSLSDITIFDRDLESLVQLPQFTKVRGLVIGRFESASGITRTDLVKCISLKEKLRDIPVIANVDFGHTEPRFTIPIGGEGKIDTRSQDTKIFVIKH